MKKKKIGEVLQDRGKISPADLQKVIGEQQGKVIHLGELMLERGLVAKEDLGAALEEVSRIPYVDCASIVPDLGRPEAGAPRRWQSACASFPYESEQKHLVVAMAAPQNLAALDELRFTTGLEISPRLSFRTELQQAINKHYATEGGGASGYGTVRGGERVPFEEVEFLSTSSRQANQEAIQEVQADLRQKKTPAVRLVSEVIQVAMAKRASDIHIEPRASDTVVRMRVDGVLHDHQVIPRSLQNSLISRIKILSDMDISERRAPQDGRFMVSVGTRQLDLRVSTLPTQYGEKVVIRLLETSAPLTSYVDLGMPADVADGLNELLSAPQGMILVTGPTGSGKSTTLYSSLHKLRQASVNIVTVEDPVEYVLPGINQVHVNTKAGLTFVSLPAVHSPPGSEHHHGGRDSRQGNRGNRHEGGANGPSGALHAAHQRQRFRDCPPARPWHSRLPDQFVRDRHPGAAPGPNALPLPLSPACDSGISGAAGPDGR